jgi:hypothetical protein
VDFDRLEEYIFKDLNIIPIIGFISLTELDQSPIYDLSIPIGVLIMTVIPSGVDEAPGSLGRNVPSSFSGFRRNSFAPLFDIVKNTTTEGRFPFYRRQSFERLCDR